MTARSTLPNSWSSGAFWTERCQKWESRPASSNSCTILGTGWTALIWEWGGTVKHYCWVAFCPPFPLLTPPFPSSSCSLPSCLVISPQTTAVSTVACPHAPSPHVPWCLCPSAHPRPLGGQSSQQMIRCDLPEAPPRICAKHPLLPLPACQAPLTRKGKDPPGFSGTSICFVFNALALLQQIKARGPGRRERSPPLLHPSLGGRLWKRPSSAGRGAHYNPPCRNRADIRQSPEP